MEAELTSGKGRASGFAQVASQLRRAPLIPLVCIVALIVVALLAPFLAPYPPTEGVLANKLMPPVWVPGGSSDHPLGTDSLGRDVLSRLIYGSRTSLTVSLLSIFISATIGTALGITSGYFGGWVDAAIMRLTDAALSLPLILMAIILAVLIGASFMNVILVIGLLLWPRFARQIRGEVLGVKEQDFVALARVAGCSDARIMIKDIFPNVVPTLLVLSTFEVGAVIILEASLSFLGVGIPPPEAAWGLMVAEGRGLLRTAWWLSLFPGIAIMVAVLSINLLGDWVRDRLDPRLRQL